MAVNDAAVKVGEMNKYLNYYMHIFMYVLIKKKKNISSWFL